MSLTGILLDVSGSMKINIGSGTDEEGGPWARSIFKVIDDLIEHDVTSENQVFAVGVGASCGKEIFDIIGTVQQIEKKNMPATNDHINKIFEILEKNGARNIRKWAKVDLVQKVVSDYMAALILMNLESDEQFVRKFVDEILPRACRDKVQIAPNPLPLDAALDGNAGHAVDGNAGHVGGGIAVHVVDGNAGHMGGGIAGHAVDGNAGHMGGGNAGHVGGGIAGHVVDGNAGHVVDGNAGHVGGGIAGHVVDGNAGHVGGGIAGHAVHGNAGHAVHGNAGHVGDGNSGHVGRGIAGHAVHGNAGHAVHGNAGHVVHGNAGHVGDGNSGHVVDGNAGHVVDGNAGHAVHGINVGHVVYAAVMSVLFDPAVYPAVAGFSLLAAAGRTVVQPILKGLHAAAYMAEDVATSAVSCFKSATEEDIRQVVEKAKRYLKKKRKQGISLKEVGTHSIFSVQDASRIIRGCIDEKELSKERGRELLENIEPYIYGGTPLYQSLDKATELFQESSSKDANHTKLLFVLSDGMPTDGSNDDTGKIDQVVSKLTKEHVKVVSCFITKATGIQPKRLYDEMPPDWEPGAKFLFSLSSELPTQLLPRAILVKRGWTIDVANNETKLFVQVNHPDHLREACDMARDVVCCQDALSDLLVSVDLDIYISQSTNDFEAKKQEKKTCYANASATVLHLAMKRILGREGGYPDFHALRDEMIELGVETKLVSHDGAKTWQVLEEICPKYRLYCHDVNPKEAMQAIVEKRPVVATYYLTKVERKIFRNFYKNDPTGILTENEIDISNRSWHAPTIKGHAVVLTSFNSKCLTLMNSWGPEWADMGFFRVRNADVLEMDFFDVNWELEDLTEGEKRYYDDHGSEVAGKLMKLLKGLQKAEYTCPKCSETSLVTAFTGTLSKVKCPKCSQEFSTNENAGNILALNMYLTSLSR